MFIEPGSPWENGYVESFFRYAPGRAAGAGSVRHAAGGQGAHRAVAAALQHCPTAQCPWVSPPGSRGAAALCGCYGCASATALGWSVGGQKPNLESGFIHGGRSLAEDRGAALFDVSGAPLRRRCGWRRLGGTKRRRCRAVGVGELQRRLQRTCNAKCDSAASASGSAEPHKTTEPATTIQVAAGSSELKPVTKPGQRQDAAQKNSRQGPWMALPA